MNSETGKQMTDTATSSVSSGTGTTESTSPPENMPAMDFTKSPKTDAVSPIKGDTAASPTASVERKTVINGEPERIPSSEHQGTDWLEEIPPPKFYSEGSLELRIRDSHGDPIPNLRFRILVKNKEVFQGATDAQGEIPKIESLKIGSVFEIQIKKDAGGYKLAAIGKIEGEENHAYLQSPKTRFEFNTVSHMGSPGAADTRKQQTIKSHNQKPSDLPKISGNTDKKPDIKDDRDDKGNPKASVIDGIKDWYNRNTNDAAAPKTADSDLEYVKRLIEFGEKQAKWKYKDSIVTNEYIQKMAKGTFETPESKGGDGYKNGIGGCTKYVKIALWYAGYNPPQKKGKPLVSIGSNIVPARLMGPALEEAGFQNVTNQLPDARWAAPGDVIVYKRTAAPNASGHIDIRTYDGYLSDFLGLYLPVRQFTVTGIYRKHSDLFAEKRMRAFLMVIASREAKTIFLKDGYQEAYLALPGSGKFSSFKTHPFADHRTGSSASGAYGITVDTWRRHLPYLQLGAGEDTFSAIIQDRIAIAIMELNHNALALVRQDKIEEAARSLATVKYIQWPSLPGGDQSNGYTATQMMDAYNAFLKKVE